MHLNGRRWADICSKRIIFKLTLLCLTIFVCLQVVELFVNVHYSEWSECRREMHLNIYLFMNFYFKMQYQATFNERLFQTIIPAKLLRLMFHLKQIRNWMAIVGFNAIVREEEI